MLAAYLWLNAVLYGGLALLCTWRHAQTARALGYSALSNSGQSEYLVIYGGLQFGLAIFFAATARHPEWHRIGLLFALALYAPIVLYRLVTVARFWPVQSLTLGVAVLELALLAAAAALYWMR